MTNDIFEKEKKIFEEDDNLLLLFKIINKKPFLYRKSNTLFWNNSIEEEFIRCILDENDFRKEIFKQIAGRSDWLKK